MRGDAGVPAQLSFLTIYNPSLGNTDETLYEQVLYFYSRKTRSRRKRRDEGEEGQILPGEEKNEQLRQIGLAQGTVEFARSVRASSCTATCSVISAAAHELLLKC